MQEISKDICAANLVYTSIPANIKVSKKAIRKVIFKCMVQSNIDRSFASFVAKKISIAKSYGESIREILDNTNTMAKKFNKDAPLKCSCNEIFALGGKCGYLFGHAWIKGEDVKDDLL